MGHRARKAIFHHAKGTFEIIMTVEYKKELAKNTAWNTLEYFSLLGIQLLCTFVLARFLTPSDFGIVGMLVVFTAIAQVIVDSGFGTAIIREKEVRPIDYSSVFYLNVLIAIVIYAILYFCSPLIADFYHEPILEDVCKVTFLVIPLLALQLIQTTILQRELQFKKLAIITFVSSASSSIIAVIMAYYLRNVWALVLQNLMTFLFKTILLWVFGKWHPLLQFSWIPIRKYFKFSKNLLLSGLIGSVFNNINALLIGRFYTSADLGFYSQANRITNVASIGVSGVIRNVSYPVLSKVNNEGGNLREGYKKIILVTMIFVGGIVALLMGVAQDLMELLMGSPEWRVAGKYVFILGIAGILHPLHAINQNILNVKGKSRSVLYLEITRRCILIIILTITVHFDVTVFVMGYSIYSILLLFLNLYVCGKPINYGIWEQFADVLPIFARQAVMIGVALLSNYLLADTNIWIRIFASLSLSVCCGIILFHKHPQFKDVCGMVIQKFHEFKPVNK